MRFLKLLFAVKQQIKGAEKYRHLETQFSEVVIHTGLLLSENHCATNVVSNLWENFNFTN